MFIMSENGRIIINTKSTSRFMIQKKSETVLIVAEVDKQAVVIGRYKNEKEAESALFDLGTNIENGYLYQLLSSSCGQYKNCNHGLHGEKKKSHGGS